MTDFYDKLNQGYYTFTGIKVPARPVAPRIFNKAIKDLTADEYNQLGDQLIEYNNAKANYEKIMKERNELYCKHREEFRKDLAEYYGVTDNPKCDKAYSIACEHGDSLSEIAMFFGEIVELIQ